MFTTLASLSLLALAAAASPIKRAGPGPWCGQWSYIGFDLASNFTLAAYNVTATYDPNPVGEPLVLGQAGAIDGASFHVLSTAASYPYGDPKATWSLQSGALIPDDQSVKTVGEPVYAGSEPGWVSTNSDAGDSAQIWCAVPQTSPHGGGTGYPTLTVNADLDQFSLCKTGNTETAQNNIVYKASPAANTGYLYETCYNVTIQIVENY